MSRAAGRPGGLELTRRGLAHMSLPSGGVLADMGCGAGESVRFLRGLGHAAWGLDKERRGGDAEGRPRFPLILGRAEAPPLASASFDGLLCECVLCLLPEPERGLRVFAELARPGGQLLLSDIYAKGSTNTSFLSRPALEAALHCAGWRVTHFEDHSPALKEYAAQMLWRGDQGAGECRFLTAAKGCGYGLWTACKEI